VQIAVCRGLHTPARHAPLRQSSAALHPLPTPQAPQLVPQSTSVSAPFSTPSVHDGDWQMPATHTPL
jgi:hypothetical protein